MLLHRSAVVKVGLRVPTVRARPDVCCRCATAAVAIILSTVSFLGFGAEPPHRDLGLMIAASKAYFLDAWWTAAFPALALTLLILFARLAAGLDEGERA